MPNMSIDTHPDMNETAARVVGETAARHSEALPADLEAAWAKWSAGAGRVDARTMALLRAAFEAGAKAGRSTRDH
jgi:hypothetical protein